MIWARRWSGDKISSVRKKDARAAAAYFDANKAGKAEATPAITEKTKNKKAKGGFKKRIEKWFGVKDS